MIFLLTPWYCATQPVFATLARTKFQRFLHGEALNPLLLLLLLQYLECMFGAGKCYQPIGNMFVCIVHGQ